MRALVLGGGIAGVTTAYFLAKDGHEVTLLEEQDGVGRDASAGNAGIIAPGHSFAWASPKAPGMLLRSLLGHETAIRVRPRLDPALVRLGSPVPPRVHRGARPAQHARQAPPLPVQPDRDDRSGERRGDRVPRRASRRALPLPRPARAGGGSPEDGAPRRARTAPGDPGSRPGRAARSRLRAGPPQDRGRRPRRRRLERRLAAVHGEPGADLPRQARRDRAARRAGHRAPGRRRTASRARSPAPACSPPTPTCSRSASARRSSRARSACASGSTPPRATPRRSRVKADGLAPTVPGVDEQWLVGWSRQGDRLRLTSTAEFAGYDRSAHPARLQQHPAARARPLPRRGRLGARGVPRVPPADDPGRPAGPGPRTPPESLLQRRPRPHGLDDGVRHGPDRDGPDRRAEARARSGRPRAPFGRGWALAPVDTQHLTSTLTACRPLPSRPACSGPVSLGSIPISGVSGA